MRGAGLIAAGLMSVWMMVGCGGTLEESPADTSAGAEVEALYACPLGGSCPPNTQCVDGLCRNCAITPQFCGLVAPAERGAAVEAQAIERIPPGGPVLSYCWNLEGQACSRLNATARCTDGTYSDYVCTCRSDGRYDCPEVR